MYQNSLPNGTRHENQNIHMSPAAGYIPATEEGIHVYNYLQSSTNIGIHVVCGKQQYMSTNTAGSSIVMHKGCSWRWHGISRCERSFRSQAKKNAREMALERRITIEMRWSPLAVRLSVRVAGPSRLAE
jgi:hypothetical protein